MEETQTAGWTHGVHRRIANAIRQAREDREDRLTAQQLADETARLGHPISRSRIANYESGRKQSLDVTELLVLAAALKVPPVALLFPHLPDGDAEPLPGSRTTAADAMGWFTGELVDETEDAKHTDETRLVALVRKRFDAQRKLRRIYDGLELAQLMGRQVTDGALTLAAAAEEVADINRQISAIPTAVVAKSEGK